MRTFFVFLLVCGAAWGQSKAEQRGRQIIDDAIQALGGDNFLALKTKVERGRMYSFYRGKLSGLVRATIYTKYLIAPDPPDINELYLRERQAFGKKWSVVFNEVDGWEVTYRGAKPLKKETIEQHRDRRQRDILYILLRRLNEKGLIIEYRTSDVIDNKPVLAVDITDADNRLVTVYFHYSTKLPVREFYQWRDASRRRHDELIIYDNFRDVGGGVKLPYILRRDHDGEKVFSMFAEKVEINVPLSESDVSLPADIKILEREK